MEQLGEAVTVLFLEDLAQEYEDTCGQLVYTAVVGSNNDAKIVVEANASVDLVCTPLLHLVEIATEANVKANVFADFICTSLPSS